LLWHKISQFLAVCRSSAFNMVASHLRIGVAAVLVAHSDGIRAAERADGSDTVDFLDVALAQQPALCSLNPGCAALGLQDPSECCPAPDGTYLACCGEGANWKLVSPGKSCADGCAELGMVCDDNAAVTRNHEVDTPAEMQSVLSAFGVSCTNFNQDFGSNADVPSVYLTAGPLCFLTAAARDPSTFTCDAAPVDDGQAKRRLCQCRGAAAPTPVLPPTPAPASSWQLVSGGLSCTAGCAQLGMNCDNSVAAARNAEVDTPAEVQFLVKKFDLSCNNFDQTFGFNTDVPSVYVTAGPTCFVSAPARDISTFSCDAAPVGDATAKRRLCVCSST